MRVGQALAVALVLGAAAGAPAPAGAHQPICPPRAGSVSDPRLLGLGGAAETAAREALGAQFVSQWLGADAQSLTVGFSPGALDVAAAQAAVRERLTATLSAEDAAYLAPRVAFAPTPYSRAQLDAVAQDLLARRTQVPNVNGFGLGCSGDAVRVQLLVGKDTPEYRAQVEAFLGAHAPLVHVTYGFGEVQSLVGQIPKAPRPARAYVSLPSTKRCIRGTLVVKPREGTTSVHLQAGRRSVHATGGKAARLRLTARSTKVKLSVAVGSAVAEQTFTYRRCG